mgnify:CR=1 FL=1
MKKIKILLISLISMFAFNTNVYAASSSISVSSGNVYVGDSFTVSLYVNSSAAWNVHVTASGPVSGCTIHKADASDDALDTNRSFSATCTATGEGTIVIRLSGDVTSASDGNAVPVSGSRSVSVSQKPAPSPSPTPSQPGNNNNNNNNQTNNNNNKQNSTQNDGDNKSKNNNIKNISVDGYNLIKVDSNNYTLSVTNDVTNINVKATAEDAKSKVTGTGNHNINVGENNIEIIVTAENGSQNKINIKVTRKDGYYLEDLDSILNKNKITDINITIKSDTIVTKEDLEKIKNSKKTVKFNYYNDDKSLAYSWIIDGSKIKTTSNLSTIITNDSDNKKDILKLSNYADGLFVVLKQNDLPLGTKLKLFVGNKYENNDFVNVYSYRNNKLYLLKNKIKMDNGYVEFDLDNASEYFVTMSTIPNTNITTKVENNEKISILPIIILIICLVIIGIIIIFIIKNKRKKKSNYDDYEELSDDYSLFEIKNNEQTIKSANNNDNVN